MQRFLTEARWDDDAVIARLQEYLGPRLEHPLAVWVFDGSGFPKQGVKSAGVARQYCGALGKIANCQAGVFLAHMGPRGRALADQRLYLPEAWTSDAGRCAAAGVPEERRRYRSKTDLALDMLEQARARGCLSAGWVAGDSAFGMSPAFRDGLAATGMLYVLDVRPDMTVWPLEPAWSEPAYQGFGRPRQPKLRSGQRLTMTERSLALPEESWREITVAEGSQGPRTYVEVLPGNAPDNLGALELVERSEANTGVPVEEALGDAAYGDGDTRQAFADAGRTLIARVPGRPNRKHFPKEDFRIDLAAGTCTCTAGRVTRKLLPAGKRTGSTGRTHRLQAFRFDAAVCGVCPLRPRCVAGSSGKGRTVQLHPQEGFIAAGPRPAAE